MANNKIIYTLIALILILIVLGIILYSKPSEIGSPEPKKITNSNDQSDIQKQAESSIDPYTIHINSDGFSPRTARINVGDTITFVNQDSRSHQPASDFHPTHRSYPGSDIRKCGTSQESSIFDACKPILRGESYSFTFTQEGIWHYHDHLRPTLKGTIIVE